MNQPLNERIVLNSRPTGLPRADDFRLEQDAVPVPADGQVLLQILYLSLDPYMRGRMDERARGIHRPAAGAELRQADRESRGLGSWRDSP